MTSAKTWLALVARIGRALVELQLRLYVFRRKRDADLDTAGNAACTANVSNKNVRYRSPSLSGVAKAHWRGRMLADTSDAMDAQRDFVLQGTRRWESRRVKYAVTLTSQHRLAWVRWRVLARRKRDSHQRSAQGIVGADLSRHCSAAPLPQRHVRWHEAFCELRLPGLARFSGPPIPSSTAQSRRS